MSPRQAVGATLASIVESETDLKLDALDEIVGLRDGLKLDSVDLICVLMRVEGHFGIKFSTSDMANTRTVGDLISLILSRAPAADLKAA